MKSIKEIIKFLIFPTHKQHKIFREKLFEGFEKEYKTKLIKKI